jgi:hypothetical protein
MANAYELVVSPYERNTKITLGNSVKQQSNI